MAAGDARDVLVVDDDRASLRWLARVLERRGYDVRTARDGNAALDAIAEAPPVAVLLDLLLPRLDGFGVLARLRADPAGPKVPVIVLSGVYGDPEVERELIAAGATRFLRKPFTAEAVVEALEEVIGPRPVPCREEGARLLDLAETPVIEVVWQAMQEDVSGALHFVRGEARKVVLLHRGEPTGVYSNQVSECLGQRLLHASRIEAPALEESLRISTAEGRRQGEILVALGHLSRNDLDVALRQQAIDKLGELFAWPRGRAWIAPGVSELARATPVCGWDAEALFFEGARRTPVQRLRPLLEPHAQQVIRMDAPDLSELAEEDTLRSFESGFSVGALMRTHPAAVYRGWRSGRIQFVEDARARPRPAVDWSDALRRVSSQNLFEVLGLDVEDPSPDVDRAFQERAAPYAACQGTEIPRRVRHAVEGIYARLCRARSVLSDPESRAAYRAKLREAEDAPITLMACAEVEGARAEDLLARGQIHDARIGLERALAHAPTPPHLRALHGWALFLDSRGQARGMARALDLARRTVQEHPDQPSPLYHLGMIHRALGNVDRARAYFTLTLQLDPDHPGARREWLRLRRRA